MQSEVEEETSSSLRETLYLRLFEIACEIAIQEGITRDSVEDCALGFAVHMMQQPFTQSDAQPLADVWLSQCAANWVRNELRRVRRQNYHESSYALVEIVQEGSPSPVMHDQDSTLLRQEFSVRLMASVTCLSNSDQNLFVHFYILEYSCQDIAKATGRTSNAIRQALWNLRRRLRLMLEKQGLDEAEVWEYLHLFA